MAHDGHRDTSHGAGTDAELLIPPEPERVAWGSAKHVWMDLAALIGVWTWDHVIKTRDDSHALVMWERRRGPDVSNHNAYLTLDLLFS